MDENTQTYTINIGSLTVGDDTFEHRCLSASFGGEGVQTNTIPWENTEYNPWDFKYENGEFVLDVIEIPTVEVEETTEDFMLEYLAEVEERLCCLELGI